ncbi:hypothetical protein LPB140_06485 [Sphingorhabdus lutea]|uniref:Glycosyltransferase subfamily 4-like N-terminal domain-containing protein n=1 Tax=Sphingorhabdus lutea TaxID=1913578 RepID=A0A1L3JBI5_9SPHN|nr:glycosyltransferase family 4 protein [Sphingorhabdus lutea]APG62492.1 hypothetical protein LPB140_06485 [Sphingorhabdus lutea]
MDNIMPSDENEHGLLDEKKGGLKILFLSQYFYPESFSNNVISKHLVDSGHDVLFIPCVPNYPEGVFAKGYSNKLRRKDEWNGVQVRRAWTVARGSSKLRLIANYFTYPFAAFWELVKMKGAGAEVSFVSMPSPLTQSLAAILAKWFYKIPTIYWVQDIWPESVTMTLNIKNKPIIWMLEKMCGWMYRRADIVMVQSEAFFDRIKSFGVDEEKIVFFPNSAPDHYRPLTPTEIDPKIAAMIPQAETKIMFAGNIGESQDFDTIIAAADLLRDETGLKWVIIGSGRDMERVVQKIKDMGLSSQFSFLGRHEEHLMPQFFTHADAMLVSLKDYPIFALTVPYKMQCYMAAGKPIISSLNGEGGRIMEKSGAGLSVPASQPEILAQNVRAFMKLSAVEKEQMALSAREYFNSTYAPDKIYEILENALQKTAKKR